MKRIALEILYWIVTAVGVATFALLLWAIYFAVKEEIRHREAVAQLRIEYQEAIKNNLHVK